VSMTTSLASSRFGNLQNLRYTDRRKATTAFTLLFDPALQQPSAVLKRLAMLRHSYAKLNRCIGSDSTGE